MGHLPARMGEPAGGSLSADEYKLATLIMLPLAVSMSFPPPTLQH